MSAIRTAAPGVLAQELDGETILLDSTSGTYFRLNETGTTVWEFVATGRSIDEAVDAIVERSGADASTVRADVDALLLTLETKGLVSSAP